MNRRRKALARLVVTGRHCPELLDFRKQILDLVPPLVHLTVMFPRIQPVPPRGNHRLGAALPEFPEQPVRVERLVPDQSFEGKILQKLRRPHNVVRLTGKDHQPHKIAKRVRNRGDLAGQASPGTADALAAGPPFAPAAFWCAETTVPSTHTHSKSNSSDYALKTRSKTPETAQRRKRLNTLFQLPKRAGRPRRGDPVRIRQSAASRNRRLSAAVTPGSVALPGSMGSIRAHMASVSTVLSGFIRHSAHLACAAVPAVIETKVAEIRTIRNLIVNRP